jgi:hypothetical protein
VKPSIENKIYVDNVTWNQHATFGCLSDAKVAESIQGALLKARGFGRLEASNSV